MNELLRIFQQQLPLKLTPQIFILTTTTLVGSGWLLVEPTRPPAVAQQVAANTGAPITTSSGAAEIALANHLRQVGAKMYGAYWCSHCHDQKQLFGKDAWSKVPYVECAADGLKANPQACDRAKVEAYPTWQIKNKQYLGTTSLFRLARASGYQGPTNFKNSLRR